MRKRCLFDTCALQQKKERKKGMKRYEKQEDHERRDLTCNC